jgi:hypothetical protein
VVVLLGSHSSGGREKAQPKARHSAPQTRPQGIPPPGNRGTGRSHTSRTTFGSGQPFRYQDIPGRTAPCGRPEDLPQKKILLYKAVIKIARTIADLDGGGDIGTAHISEAIQYRSLDRNTAAAPVAA